MTGGPASAGEPPGGPASGGPPPVALSTAGRRPLTHPVPQGTVRTWNAADRSGDLLLDDGTVVPFAGSAVDPVVRLLRSGQRVRLQLADGDVTRLTLLTLPFSEQ